VNTEYNSKLNISATMRLT